MRLFTFKTLFLPVFLLSVSLSYGQRSNNDEKGLWEIWKLQSGETNNPSAVIKACIEFKKKNPSDPLGAITQGIVAWNLIAIGKLDAAERILNPMTKLKASDIQKANVYFAQTWLTRIDMMKIKPHLEAYFRKNVEYPPSLDVFKSLPEDKRPPSKDRWGKPWDYKLVGFKSAPKMPKNLKYEIGSQLLGSYSDMGKALSIPYGSRMNYRPYRKMPGTPGAETIEFLIVEEKEQSEAEKIGTKPKTKILSKGMNGNGVYLAYYGAKIMAMNDGNHWKIIAKPPSW